MIILLRAIMCNHRAMGLVVKYYFKKKKNCLLEGLLFFNFSTHIAFQGVSQYLSFKCLQSQRSIKICTSVHELGCCCSCMLVFRDCILRKKKGFGICNSSVCQVTANKIYLVSVKEQIDQDFVLKYSVCIQC